MSSNLVKIFGLLAVFTTLISLTNSVVTITDPAQTNPLQRAAPIPEDSTAQTLVYTVIANSDVAGATVFYDFSVTPDSGRSKFTWDYLTGEISTIAEPKFNFEADPLYTFTVTASDGSASDTHTFELHIENVNERPIITNLPDGIKLTEGDPGNYSIFTFDTRDPDHSEWTYEFESITPAGCCASVFALNFDGNAVTPPHNELWLLRRPGLNYEEVRDYNLSIVAVDADGLKSYPKFLHVEIRDINEAPVFTDTAATATIYEESPIGTTLVTNIGPPRALDPDIFKNDTVTYLLEGKYSDYFNIETYNQEAVITLAKRLDRESVDDPVSGSFTLYVSAIDRLSLRQATSNTFQIEVTPIDVNDHPTICDQQIYQGSIQENSPIDTSILTLSCTDSDDVTTWPITYRVNDTGLPDKYFYFPPSPSNQLSARYPMDLEAGQLLSFIVDVVQGAPYNTSSTTVSVEISVVGENDNRPNMSQAFYNFDFRYDVALNTEVGLVAASDNDVTTSVVSFDWVYAVTEFYMFTLTGIITTKTSFTPGQRFVYYALAKDNDIPPDVSVSSPVRFDTFDPTLYLIDFQVVQPVSYFTEARKQEFEDAISSSCPPCFGRISRLYETPGSPTTTTIEAYALTDDSTESYQNFQNAKTYIPKETLLDHFTVDSTGTPSSAVALPGFFNYPVVKVTPTNFGLTFLEWLLYTPEGNATLGLVCAAALASLIGTLIYLWRTGALARLFRLLMACNIGDMCKDCCKSEPPEPVTKINHPGGGGDFNVFEFRYKEGKPLALKGSKRL